MTGIGFDIPVSNPLRSDSTQCRFHVRLSSNVGFHVRDKGA